MKGGVDMVKIDFIAIGNRIRETRKANGLTQKELAKRVGLSEGSISKYEHGKVEDATSTMLNKFATVLGVPIDWLLGLDAGVNNHTPGTKCLLSDSEIHLVEIYRSVNAEGVEFINHALETAAVMYPAQNEKRIIS